MWTNTQFTGSLGPSASGRWFTFGWPSTWQVVWYMMPTTPNAGTPAINWTVDVERADTNNCTYWLDIHNLSGQPVDFEARYAVLG